MLTCQLCCRVGVSALFKGVSPAMARGLFYGGLRIGMYSPIKTWMAGEGNKVSMQTKLGSGCASGAIAAAITNPIELVRWSCFLALCSKFMKFTTTGIDQCIHVLDSSYSCCCLSVAVCPISLRWASLHFECVM